ncbi:MAG TPA: hypothetical protein VFH73_19435 [Polyangia bacterium]|jgi:hypothetical protein|nr:hypothetical protein [Polyangia bacterium]
MPTRVLKVPAAILLLLAASPMACGGGPSSADGGVQAACTPFSACGGDLAGTWKVVESCPTPSGVKKLADKLKFCPAASVSIDDAKFTGTVVYDGHGTIKNDVTFNIRVSTTFPSSCVKPGETCETTHPAPAQGATMDMPCVSMPAGCSCQYRLTGTSNRDNGYQAAGTTLTETDVSNGQMKSSQYCVSGGVLRIQNDDETDVLTR